MPITNIGPEKTHEKRMLQLRRTIDERGIHRLHELNDGFTLLCSVGSRLIERKYAVECQNAELCLERILRRLRRREECLLSFRKRPTGHECQRLRDRLPYQRERATFDAPPVSRGAYRDEARGLGIDVQMTTGRAQI